MDLALSCRQEIKFADGVGQLAYPQPEYVKTEGR